jgi:predicted nucleotide-binding protein
MAKRQKFNVLVLHGHGDGWQTIQEYVQECGFTARVLMQEPANGVLFNRFRDVVWYEVHCAIVLMTKDDRIAGRKGSFRARQNVVFELGYCFGAFDSLPDDEDYEATNAVIVVEEEGVERFANIEGLVAIRFAPDRLSDQKDRITQALEHAYKKAKAFYEDL